MRLSKKVSLLEASGSAGRPSDGRRSLTESHRLSPADAVGVGHRERTTEKGLIPMPSAIPARCTVCVTAQPDGGWRGWGRFSVGGYGSCEQILATSTSR